MRAGNSCLSISSGSLCACDFWDVFSQRPRQGGNGDQLCSRPRCTNDGLCSGGSSDDEITWISCYFWHSPHLELLISTNLLRCHPLQINGSQGYDPPKINVTNFFRLMATWDIFSRGWVSTTSSDKWYPGIFSAYNYSNLHLSTDGSQEFIL